MLRKTVLFLCLMALAIPASSAVYVTNGLPSQPITISLNIGAYTNIWWAPSPGGYSDDGNDQSIVFNGFVQDGSNNGDWYSPVLTGAYGSAPAASTDAFAVDYYESYDAALFWMESNVNCQMQLLSGGDLTNTTGPGTLPTWYTVALTNNWLCSPPNCGFIDGGVRQAHPTLTIPLGGGQGWYAEDVSPVDGVMELFGGVFYPNQYSFPMAGSYATYLGNFTAFAQGTILFHARVLRAGYADPAGTYTTTLTVTFI